MAQPSYFLIRLLSNRLPNLPVPTKFSILRRNSSAIIRDFCLTQRLQNKCSRRWNRICSRSRSAIIASGWRSARISKWSSTLLLSMPMIVSSNGLSSVIILKTILAMEKNYHAFNRAPVFGRDRGIFNWHNWGFFAVTMTNAYQFVRFWRKVGASL